MAMKIRCGECSKKLSIDEAFAGGVCRCPYCKALIFVPGESSAPAASRPATPVWRPEPPPAGPQPSVGAGAEFDAEEPAVLRPAEPGLAPDDAELARAHGQSHIPTARPVKLQGIVAMVLIGLLIAMVAAAVILLTKMAGTGKGPEAGPPQRVNPLVSSGSGPMAAGFKIEPPVVYVLDSSSSMRQTFDYALVIARASVNSLKADQKFGVVLAREEADKLMPGGLLGGGPPGAKALNDFLATADRTGATNINRALLAALDQKPRTVVLLARKPVDSAMPAARRAKAEGVKIFAVALDADEESIGSMEALAKAADGDCRAYSQGDLERFLAESPQD